MVCRLAARTEVPWQQCHHGASTCIPRRETRACADAHSSAQKSHILTVVDFSRYVLGYSTILTYDVANHSGLSAVNRRSPHTRARRGVRTATPQATPHRAGWRRVPSVHAGKGSTSCRCSPRSCLSYSCDSPEPLGRACPKTCTSRRSTGTLSLANTCLRVHAPTPVRYPSQTLTALLLQTRHLLPPHPPPPPSSASTHHSGLASAEIYLPFLEPIRTSLTMAMNVRTSTRAFGALRVSHHSSHTRSVTYQSH